MWPLSPILSTWSLSIPPLVMGQPSMDGLRFSACFVVFVIFVGVATKYGLQSAGLKSVSVYGQYCGPNNGFQYTKEPVDALDTLCKEHDWCIESKIGQKIPLRSHTNPAFGCVIKDCDTAFIKQATLDKDLCKSSLLCSIGTFLALQYHQRKVHETCIAIRKNPMQWKCSCS